MSRTYEIAGRSVRMPVGVRDASAALAAFAVPAAKVDLWLPPGLAPLPAGPGRALLLLTGVDYRDNDLGSYRELFIGVAVRRGWRTGVYVHRLPVDDEFSKAAGIGIWGFPKTVEELQVLHDHDGTVVDWRAGEFQVLRLAVSGSGRATLPASANRAYTTLDGRLHETRFILRGQHCRLQPGGATIHLGDGDAADELRRLGLPKPALFSMTIGRMQARFDAPHPLHPKGG